MALASEKLHNVAAEGIPYFTPQQDPPAGTALDPQPNGKPIPRLFQPLRIRGVQFPNRIWVQCLSSLQPLNLLTDEAMQLSPLCQYSTKDGLPTAWQLTHLGGILQRGPGLTVAEAAAVLPEGRLTPEDAGLWNDAQTEKWAEITTFARSQNQNIACQLAHAGRKASMAAPWLAFGAPVGTDQGGWPDDVLAPSAVPHSPSYHVPRALTKEGIERVRQGFVDAAKRAVKAGFDVIEIHGGHGYLLHEFLSPIANRRTDEYGGSFENRIRLLIEIIDGIRAVIPESMPLFVRISGSDLLESTLPDEPSWRVEDSARLANIVADHGVDLIDISAGGVHPLQEVRLIKQDGRHAAYQAYLADHVRKAVEGKILVSAVGGIKDGRVAEEVLANGWADVCFVGRHFTKNPGAVWQFAEDLGVVIAQAHQIEWGFLGRGVGRKRIDI
ncbi:NADH:flavin oxidoreductase/NADH oxidase [Phanerochaete sordida]|uniref:NADH:flavin oxidoreductase/NADH oxidase n=1 Tax=Phanerochaete sordida TaxID=48140 RepID=A0A9P3GHA3_9APHY|nr:NADH:flavin oxidoreductase/NADH oxidase [Phanerochaete sordida]